MAGDHAGAELDLNSETGRKELGKDCPDLVASADRRGLGSNEAGLAREASSINAPKPVAVGSGRRQGRQALIDPSGRGARP